MRVSSKALLLCVACGMALGEGAKKKRAKAEAAAVEEAPSGPFTLSSSAFAPGGAFPVDCRGDEDNVSPALAWAGAPKGTEAFVLLADEGGTEGRRTTNWIVYDIPASVSELREELSGDGGSDVNRLGLKEGSGNEPIVVDPMESMMSQFGGSGYEDEEMAQMRRMISGAVDSGFATENRAKEGALPSGATAYKGPVGRAGSVTFKLYALTARLGLGAGASREQVVAAMKGKVLGKASLSATVAMS